MNGIADKKLLSVKDGVVSLSYGVTYDGDKDGVAAAEAGGYVKLSVGEVVKEIIAANDSATMAALAPYAKALVAMIPNVEEKSI